MGSFKITAGRKRWYVVGEYVPPNDQPTLHQVDQDLLFDPMGVETLLASNIYIRLAQPQDQGEEYLVTAIANYGLVKHTLHFTPRHRYRGKGGWSWRMWRYRRTITVRGGYIIGTVCREFCNVFIRDPRLSTDHRIILDELKGKRVRRKPKYFKGCTTWTIVAPTGVPMRQ